MIVNSLDTRQDLEELFLWLNEPLYAYIFVRCGYSRELAEDITQDVFLKVWEKRGTFNPKKSSLKNWVFIIARHQIIDMYRRKKIFVSDVNDTIENTVNIQTDSTEDEILLGDILKNLERLKKIEKEVILMRYIQDFELDDISKIIGKSSNATKVLIHRAIKKLKYIMNN